MKRLISFVISIMLSVSAVSAETADTLHKLFVRQLTGGNGMRGYVRLTASGVADWLNYLLPFTASDIQIRGIGEKQGEKSDEIHDDDDWQVRFYVKNAAGKEVGTTWLHGNPDGLYFQSELLPETIFKVPLDGIHLLYQLFQGELDELFFTFDPLGMTEAGANGNASAYEALADVLGVPALEWEQNWLPVLEKYFLHLDLWLTSFGDPIFLTGDSGSKRMSATYRIPSEDLKAEAKYIIGQMLFDNELQSLLIPLVTMEERITYLNPNQVYFYEACIDALPLEGDVILAREMSSHGEIVSTTISLPLPPLPDNLIAPIGEMASAALMLPYQDLLSGMNRLTIISAGEERKITLTGERRELAIDAMETVAEDGAVTLAGSLRVTPNAGVEENALSAAFSCTWGAKSWQDDNYLDHEQTSFALSVSPALDMLAADDPFRGTYVDFMPVSLAWMVDYRNNTFQQGSPAQVNFSINAQLPDAKIDAEGVLRITTQMSFVELDVSRAKLLSSLSDDEKTALLEQFVDNVAAVMANLSPVMTAAPQTESKADVPANE